MAGPVEMRVAHCVHDWASYTVAPMVLFILYHLVPVWLGRTVLRPARREVYEYMDKCGIDIPVWARWWLDTKVPHVGFHWASLARCLDSARGWYPEHGEALLLWAPFSVLLLLLYWSVTALHYSCYSVSADRACSTYWGVQWHWHWVYHALVLLSLLALARMHMPWNMMPRWACYR